MATHHRHVAVAVLVTFLTLALSASGPADPSAFVNFEGAQTTPIRLSRGGARLFAVNTPDTRVSVFDLAVPASPRLIAEIPVGIEPVSVNPRTDDEAWVVNQVSDSISIVSVSRGIVVDTIQVGDEPADVVFAGRDLAFVSVARSNELRVFDANTRRPLRTIPLAGTYPRALAVSPDGSSVYVAFGLSGNRTTIIRSPLLPPDTSPTNPDLPPSPSLSRIVDAADPRWAPFLRYTVQDNDVAVVDVQRLEVSGYVRHVGTINFALAVQPLTGAIHVANTDARNRIDFEPEVRGHFVDNRITRIDDSGALSIFDLNPDIDYGTLPNPAALATALAQPAALAFEPLGRTLYVAAFGTDRVAAIDPASGQVQWRVEIGPVAGAAADPRRKRGPRGLALHPAARQLYVLNRISNTISIVDTIDRAVSAELPVGSYDPTPAAIREGRGFLYDAKLSGNGTASCAACHIDADMDMLAWNLGDPGGTMTLFDTGEALAPLHPMKGPLTTQTLRGLKDMEPYHWRGDRKDFAAFNPAFDALMGGTPLPEVDMAAFTAFIETIAFQPNPHQNLDRTLPATLAGGDPSAGRIAYNQVFNPADSGSTCNTCHTAEPGPGSNRDVLAFLRTLTQPMKVPQLRNVYQKQGLNARGPWSRDGFGMGHDGGKSSVFELLSGPRFGPLAEDPVRKLNLQAFILAFDTGTAPAVGHARTLNRGDVADVAAIATWQLLESQVHAANIDLIVTGRIDGRVGGLVYRADADEYGRDFAAGEPLSRAELLEKLLEGDTFTVMGVPPGSGTRMAIDRDSDGILNGDEP